MRSPNCSLVLLAATALAGCATFKPPQISYDDPPQPAVLETEPPKPVHDDGKKVYIEFPRGIAQGEMPPLFIIGPEGKTSELVNYRVRGSHMIVDRLFAAAELRLGDRGTERRVRIVRTDRRLFW